MMPKDDGHLISEPIIDAARARLARDGHQIGIQQVRRAEPDLYYAVCRYAANALGSVEDLPSEVHDAAHRAVWEAVLLALDAYRTAHYELWRDTELGALLARLDPEQAGRLTPSQSKRPRGGDRPNRDFNDGSSDAPPNAP
ncbi:MAG TPA: hypothetical protein VGN72_09690 [Tepidisphaeraceae bacterium]|jgi:hypothetical protein|nr:hypothetical protein [Tepidisphaeraceae bacterium]